MAGGLTPQVLLRIALVVSVAVLWLADGAPVVTDAWRWLRGRERRLTADEVSTTTIIIAVSDGNLPPFIRFFE